MLHGWVDPGTFYTGAMQIPPVNVTSPNYCKGPMTKGYVFNDYFRYDNIRCVRMPSDEVTTQLNPALTVIHLKPNLRALTSET